MGTKAQEIIGSKECKKIITSLNQAFADEWLAYYQYWLGAKLAEGPMRPSVIAELEEHAKDELRHATMLSQRIIELGGTPVLTPEAWLTISTCGYETPNNPHVKKILEQNIKGEQCAIEAYNSILESVKDFDHATYHIVSEILVDEIKHEEDLEMLMRDLLIKL